MRVTLLTIGLATFFLVGCVAPPTADENASMNSAVKPLNRDTAQEAVKKYFENSLFDAEAARYRFPLPPTRGSLISGSLRQFGWFMCGEINGKNRMGGYTGYKTFFAYFSPTVRDTVVDGAIADTDDYGIIDGWCKGVYGARSS